MIRIREGRVSEARRLAEILISERRSLGSALLPRSYLDGLDLESKTDKFKIRLSVLFPESLLLVAEDQSGQLIGYAYFARPQATSHFDYELYEVYVDGQSQRRGIGRRLVSAGLERLIPISKTGIEVWTLPGNPNEAFYPRMNAVKVGESERTIGGIAKSLSVYAWPASSEADYSKLSESRKSGK